MHAQNIEPEFDDKTISELARMSYTPSFGARPIRRSVQREIDNMLSNYILEDKVHSGDKLKVIFKDGKFDIKIVK
jgi:ATP-dependent Clp protease ATP-binding subunit ClpC